MHTSDGLMMWDCGNVLDLDGGRGSIPELPLWTRIG